MKIMIYSNSTYGGWGYGIISKYIAKGLKDNGFNVINLGLQTIGKAIKDEFGNINLPLFFDAWGSDALDHYLRSYQIDCLLTIIDIWLPHLEFIPKVVRNLNLSWVCHVTINSSPLSPYLKNKLDFADIIVAPSRFNYNVLLNAGLGYKSVYIPHGINLNIFRKDNEIRSEVRKRLGYEDKFVYLCVARNKGFQKNFPALFIAYKLILENYPELKKNTILHVHAYPYEPDGINLVILRNMLGLNDNIKFSFVRPVNGDIEICSENDIRAMPHQPNWGLSEEKMVELYNMADCFVIATKGESFCLPILEAMACGLPVIMPDNTVANELVKENNTGLVAGIRGTETTPLISDVYLVDEFSLANQMFRIYEDEKLRNELSENALKFVRYYSWDKIIKMWVELFNKVREDLLKVDYKGERLGI